MAFDEIKKEVQSRIIKYSSLREAPIFLFGSSVHRPHFHDIDIGVFDGGEDDIAALRDEFEESTFPYKVDVINFSSVSNTFREKVFEEGVVWLTQKKK